MNGVCTTGTCDTGYDDCNKNPSDGCEINLNTDPTHCGVCTTNCTAANATTQCVTGQCAIANCNPGTSDCDHIYSTGCEIDTTTDKLNCGTCGFSCVSTCSANVTGVQCSASNCQVTACTQGFLDINSTCSDGCECAQTTVGSCTAPRNVTLTGPELDLQRDRATSYPRARTTGFTVTFTTPKATNYHPHVVFMTNPGAEYVFDIETNCTGGNLVCGTEKNDAGVALHSTGLTAWETSSATRASTSVDASFVAIPSGRDHPGPRLPGDGRSGGLPALHSHHQQLSARARRATTWPDRLGEGRHCGRR